MRMERTAATPESEKQRRRKWILLIAMLLSLVALITTLFFLARIEGWVGGRETTALLSIVDAETPAAENENQTLAFIDDEHMIDARCVSELEELLANCRAAGFDPRITAAYRSASEQRELFNAVAERYREQGSDAETAKALAQKEIELPGHSEHQLGLAVDLRDGEGEGDQGALRLWLESHAWEYGFILRYPQGKESVTGHPFAPEHYRYVGKDAAKQICELDITLEEYVDMFYSK